MRYFIPFALLCFFAFPFLANAQSTVPKTGKVTDSKTGESLPGASIQMVGAPDKLSTITDMEGNFKLLGNPKEGQLLRITYIGYEPMEYELKQGVQRIEIKLEPITRQIEAVEVTGLAKGEVKARVDQQNAENIKNIISAEQIEQFPDLNAAETLQRIPGISLQRDKGEGRFIQLRGTPPEYTNFNVNGEQIPSPEGNVRYVGLDVIASDQIESIEVNKVLTPDMDADGIGGSVNIITKTAKSETPEINALVSGGYSDLRGTTNYQAQFSFGQRSGKLGFNINANYYLNNQGADNMEFEYKKGTFFGSVSQEEGADNYHVQYTEFQLRHYTITRERVGVSSSLDYQLNEKSKLYIRGMYNQFMDNETRRRVIYTLDDAVSETYYLYGGIERDLKNRIKNQSISTLNLGGEQKLGLIKLDYEVSYSVAKEGEPNRMEIAFSNPGQAIFMKIDVSDPDWPVVTFPDSNNASNATNYAEYEMDEMRQEKLLVTDKNKAAKINITIPYSNSRGLSYLKFGGRLRIKEKERDYNTQIYTQYNSENVPGQTGTAPDSLLPELYDGFVENNLLNHGYTVDWTPGPQETRDFYEYYPQHFYLNKTDTKDNTFGEDYFATEDIYAAYGMVRHDIHKFMLLAGLRYEYTKIYYKGNQVIKDRRGNFVSLSDSTDSRTHQFLLPQVQLKYTLNERTNFRAAATRTFSRPNFEDVIPHKNEESDKLKLGNADLKFPQAINLDLLAERYGKNNSMISGGIFYKKIDDYIYYYRLYTRAGDPAYGNFPRIRTEVSRNGKRAFVYGAEVLSQFKLTFLPSVLKNLGLYLNYTYTYSEAYIGKRLSGNDFSYVPILSSDLIASLDTLLGEEKITLPGQAKHTANAAIFYESKKLYLKLALNYSDDFIVTLGMDKDLDEYYAPSLQLDANASYAITNNLKVFSDVKNLTNAPLKYYLGKPEANRMLKQEYYSWWFRIGIRLSMK